MSMFEVYNITCNMLQPNSKAEKQGLILVGDEILEVEGEDLRGLKYLV